jgi:hypothetical protein
MSGFFVARIAQNPAVVMEGVLVTRVSSVLGH